MTLFTKKHSWTVLRDVLGDMQSFHNNGKTFRGESVDLRGQERIPVGRMDESERQIMLADIERDGICYVIWSYATPIAWRLNGGFWRVTDRNYSVTTAQHLGKVRTAVSELRENAI